MVEDFVLVEKQQRIEVGLAGSPETLPSKTSSVIGVVVGEEHMLMEEVISLEFWCFRGWILRLRLRSISQLQHNLRNLNLWSHRQMNFSFCFRCSLGLHFFSSFFISTSGWNLFMSGRGIVDFIRTRLNFSWSWGLRNLLFRCEQRRVGVLTIPKITVHHWSGAANVHILILFHFFNTGLFSSELRHWR